MDVGADAAEMVVDVIWCNSIEYGRTNSYQTSYHNCPETASEADGEVPGWFKAGMEAALLAPTAMNQQKFKFTLKEGNKVKAEPTFSLAGKAYLNYDLGIVKYHFEVAAGKENFTWL